jgi:AraC-like DNA-binding protein
MDAQGQAQVLARSPRLLFDRPPATDPLSDLLAAVRVVDVRYPLLEETCRTESRHAHIGAVQAPGSVLLRGETQPAALEPGDFVLLAPGCAGAFDPARSHPAAIFLARLTLDTASTQSLAYALPSILIVRARRARTAALPQIFEILASAAQWNSPAAHLAARRIAEVALIQAVRSYMAGAGRAPAGWLRALADPNIGAAIRSIHQRLNRRWTVATLAAAAGMSRSAFAARFKELTGATPLEYVTRWRIYRASRLLEDGSRKLADVAHEVGYDSDASFVRAFKRTLGVAPGEYRRLVA